MSKNKAAVAEQGTHTTVTLPATVGPKPRSIRQIITKDIMNGVPKAETKAQIERFHPTTAACKKFPKHYAWYRGQLKKEGLLPTPATTESVEA